MPTPAEDTLVAMNLSKWYWEFTLHSLYTCPCEADGFLPRYIHFPAKYFAAYVNGGAKYVAHIDAVIRVTGPVAGEVLWKNVDVDDNDLLARGIPARLEAVDATSKRTLNQPPCLLFLLSDRKATDFVYDTRGGLQANSVYFDIADLKVEDTKDLADKLRKAPWSTLKKRTK